MEKEKNNSTNQVTRKGGNEKDNANAIVKNPQNDDKDERRIDIDRDTDNQ